MARRIRGPAHTHDTDQIDPPRAAAPARSGWTPAAILRMLPRGSAVHAPAAKARGLAPGLHLLHPVLYVVDAASGRVPAHSGSSYAHRAAVSTGIDGQIVADHKPSTGAHKFSVSPLDPPSDHLHPGELLV
jgi:hypothetical protein